MPISTQPQKLQQVADELGTEAKDLALWQTFKESLKLKQRNFVVEQTDDSTSNSFILSHDTNGILGTATGLGGSQIVLGETTGSVTIELIRRRYDWDNKDEFLKGNKSKNIDINQGFLQLGNVTVKNISLGHKENKNN